jgi:carboxypeptidase Taq
MATLSALRHQFATADEIGGWLEALDSTPQGEDERVMLREVQRSYQRARKIPATLVAEMTRHSVRSRAVWEQARKNDDFASFAPELRKTLELQRAYAAALDPDRNAYDVLHDLYERDSSAAEVERVFTPLASELGVLIVRVRSAPRQPDASLLERHVPSALQEVFAVELVQEMGYDFGRGRLDRAAHPFCIGIGLGDVRITTRYLEDYLPSALFGTIHEAGHGMYEQNLPEQWSATPLGEAVSLSVHESQSRLWENLVGRSPAFWRGAFPRLQRAFAGRFDDVARDDFVRAINVVRPSLIRVEADELTYHLHVLLRFEIERALIEGSLDVVDLPERWRQRHGELLGVAPHDDRDGVLQDVHWSEGMFGYFPTYTLGTLLSAQWWEAMEREIGGLDALLERGAFAPIFEWLVANVHRHGSRYLPGELVERGSGAPLSAEPFLRYARTKYAELYAL